MAQDQPVVQHAAHSNRQGLAAAIVVLALTLGLYLYGRHSVHTANTMRAEAAARAGEAYAASVRDQVDTLAGAVHTAVVVHAGSGALRETLRREDAARARALLSRAIDARGPMDDAGLYRADGRLLAATSPDLPERMGKGELRGASGRFAVVVRGPDGAARVAAAAPLAPGDGAGGYVVGLRRLHGPTAEGPDVAAAAGYAVHVTHPKGEVAAAWGDPDQVGSGDAHLEDIAVAALKEGAGSTVIFTRDLMRRRLAAYAPSTRTGQVVVVTEFSEHALAASRYQVARLFDMALPTVLLVAVAGWALFSFYHRERQLARTLADANVRLDAEARAGSDLLANVSHDLRTPLAAMRIAISGLLDPSVQWDQASARESLETARGQLDRLSAKVRNLLVMARLESARQDRRTDLCDLTDVVDGALGQVRPLLSGRPVEVDFPDQPIMVQCDQAQIETVVVNLVENALKYSPPGTPLYLAGSTHGSSARFSIRDCGPGVPPGTELSVFGKFYRGPGTSHVGGAGLGLAICKSIVEAHGGSIGVRNTPNGGAEFWFEMPLPLIEMAGPVMAEVAR